MNIEEKAKRYADGIIENCQLDSPWNCEEIHWQLRDAYTQAFTDLSAENEKLRGALRETSKELDQVFLDWYPYDDETEIFRIGAIVDKAKQLITEEK